MKKPYQMEAQRAARQLGAMAAAENAYAMDGYAAPKQALDALDPELMG